MTGAEISVPDLRAGAALVIAGLAADGYTLIDDIQYIERGYENFDEKLRQLGGQIKRQLLLLNLLPDSCIIK